MPSVSLTWLKWPKLYRCHQWSKNGLVAVPLLASHRLAEWPLLIEAVLAFLSLSLAASAGYILNDLRDLDADRAHAQKRERVLAKGEVTPRAARRHAWAAALSGLGLAWLVDASCALALLAYLAASLSYTRWWKRLPLLDVTVLALLYVYRMFYGGLFYDILPTDWLLVFGFFLFLSLAMAKRFAECAGEWGEATLFSRGYEAGDVFFVQSYGTSAGMIAVMVLAIYLKSEHVSRLYARPDFLWIAVLACFLWTARMWFRASRRKLDHDPVLFALRDPVSYGLGLATVAAMLLAGPK